MKNKGLIAIIVILAAAICILAWVNASRVGSLDSASLSVKVQGEEVGAITLEEIAALGGEEFAKVLRSSGKEPKESLYTGVPLIKVLEAVKPGSVTPGVQVTVLASDGYAVTYSGSDILRPEHIYLVWLKDGKALGTKAKGGLGPLLVIPRQDEYGQFWCKFVVEADIR